MNKYLTATKIAAKIFGSRGNNGTSIGIVSSTATVNRTMDTLLLFRHRYNSYVLGCVGVPPRLYSGNVAMTFSSFTLVQPYTCKRSTIISNISNTVLISVSSSSISTSSLSRSLNALHQFVIGIIRRDFTSTSDFDSTSDIVKNKLVPEFTLDEQELLEKIEFKGGSFIDIDDFEKLTEKGLCKKIAETFCQDNRDYERYEKSINKEKLVLLNQTLDTELVEKSRRKSVYYATKNGEVLAESVRTRQKVSDIKGKKIGRFPNSKILERVVRVVTKTDGARGYKIVWLHKSKESLGSVILATFVGNRPPGKKVDHINRCQDNTRLQNLRWAKRKNNKQTE